MSNNISGLRVYPWEYNKSCPSTGFSHLSLELIKSTMANNNEEALCNEKTG